MPITQTNIAQMESVGSHPHTAFYCSLFASYCKANNLGDWKTTIEKADRVTRYTLDAGLRMSGCFEMVLICCSVSVLAWSKELL
jgi:hypothetical protein